MNALDLLRGARELIANPEHWCQFAYARNRKGMPVDSKSRMACKWCSIGAVSRVQYLFRHRCTDTIFIACIFKLDEASKKLGEFDCNTLNDYRSHSDVMKMFDLAITKESDSQ